MGTDKSITQLTLKSNRQKFSFALMAPLDQDTEALTPLASPPPESSAPRVVTYPHHISPSWDGQSRLDETWSSQEQNHASPSPTLLPHSMSRATTDSALESGPIRRRPSLLIPKVDVKNDALDVCPCCHLRRRSSTESAGLRSPKHIHTALDECCSPFCPDLSLPQAGHSPVARPHVGHSRLCEETSAFA
jgi:hypothetical protein